MKEIKKSERLGEGRRKERRKKRNGRNGKKRGDGGEEGRETMRGETKGVHRGERNSVRG